MKFTASAFGCSVYFIGEQRSELYSQYCSRVAQSKNVLGAKNDFKGRALLGLGRRVA